MAKVARGVVKMIHNPQSSTARLFAEGLRVGIYQNFLIPILIHGVRIYRYVFTLIYLDTQGKNLPIFFDPQMEWESTYRLFVLNPPLYLQSIPPIA